MTAPSKVRELAEKLIADPKARDWRRTATAMLRAARERLESKDRAPGEAAEITLDLARAYQAARAAERVHCRLDDDDDD